MNLLMKFFSVYHANETYTLYMYWEVPLCSAMYGTDRDFFFLRETTNFEIYVWCLASPVTSHKP